MLLPQMSCSSLLKMKTTLKRKAEVSPSSLRDIFDEVSNETPVEVATQLSFQQVESGMCKRRLSVLPNLPTSAVACAQLLDGQRDLFKSFQRSIVSDNG